MSICLFMDMEGLEGICLDGKVENDSPKFKVVLLAHLVTLLLMAILEISLIRYLRYHRRIR